MTDPGARASKEAVPPLSLRTQVAVIGSGVMGVALTIVGVHALIAGGMPLLLAITLIAIGLLGVALGAAAWRRRRGAWAILAATWGVVAFCAFFGAPKIVAMPQLEAATVELELKLGRQKAEAQVADKNVWIRLSNLGLCTMFALPFGLLCAGLASGGREFEGRT